MTATLSATPAQILTVRADLIQRFLKHSILTTKLGLADLVQIETAGLHGPVFFRRTDGENTVEMETTAVAGGFSGVIHIDDLKCLADADPDGPVSFHNEWIKYYCCNAPVQRKIECRPPVAFFSDAFREYSWSREGIWTDAVLNKLRKMLRCASGDDNREAITGVRVCPNGVAVATDGRMMTVNETLPSGLIETATTFNWLPPATCGKEFAVSLAYNVPPANTSHEDREKWVYHTTQIKWVSYWKDAIFTKVQVPIAQNYPDWKSIEIGIMEKQCGETTSVQLPFSLKEMIKRVTAKFSADQKRSAAIILSADGEAVKLTSPTLEIQIGGVWTGANPDWNIAFCPELISDALALDHYRMSITDEMSPAVFSPIGNRGEYTIVMPMRVATKTANAA